MSLSDQDAFNGIFEIEKVKEREFQSNNAEDNINKGNERVKTPEKKNQKEKKKQKQKEKEMQKKKENEKELDTLQKKNVNKEVIQS